MHHPEPPAQAKAAIPVLIVVAVGIASCDFAAPVVRALLSQVWSSIRFVLMQVLIDRCVHAEGVRVDHCCAKVKDLQARATQPTAVCALVDCRHVPCESVLKGSL